MPKLPKKKTAKPKVKPAAQAPKPEPTPPPDRPAVEVHPVGVEVVSVEGITGSPFSDRARRRFASLMDPPIVLVKDLMPSGQLMKALAEQLGHVARRLSEAKTADTTDALVLCQRAATDLRVLCAFLAHGELSFPMPRPSRAESWASGFERGMECIR